jgi:hypothetical protein
MFKMSQSETYTWPTKVESPISGGKSESQQFDVEFKRLPQSRINEVKKSAMEGTIHDLEFCQEIMVGWKDVFDENGKEVPFSATSRDKFLDIANVAKSIVRAFFESLDGAKIKN